MSAKGKKRRSGKRKGDAAGRVVKATGPSALDPVTGLPLDAIRNVRLREARRQ